MADFRDQYTMRQLATTFNAILDRDGVLDPERMHDEFAATSHPLHSRYEWDDRIAARAYRVGQIQQDIRSVKVEWINEATGEVESVRAYPSLKRAGTPTGSGYGEVDKVLADPVSAELMMRRLMRQISSLRKQYGHLTDFVEIVRRELLGEEGGAA